MYDWLIVGAGFSGAVLAERIASQLRQRVLLIDRRNHIGGNAADYIDSAGVLVHRYGPHLFHTNSPRVSDYLGQFTAWRPYAHRVRAVVDGKQIPLPINLTSLRLLFGQSRARQFERSLKARFGPGHSVPVLQLRQDRDPQLRQLGQVIYEKIFHGYTVKQWGLRPEQLSPAVTGRIPIRISHDDRYFTDEFQAMPAEGYTAMFHRMLGRRGIDVSLNTALPASGQGVRFKRMIHTGPIDEYFDYMHGPLPYRSLRFAFDTVAREELFEVGQLNYPGPEPYTRVTEIKHATAQKIGFTTISREFPMAHEPGKTEPYYPIPRDVNRRIYLQYHAEAQKLRGRVIFCGRLAEYQYYNMDQIIAHALMVFEKEIATNAHYLRRPGDLQSCAAAA